MTGTPTGLVFVLLEEFARDLREARTINQLARSSGKAYANTHAAMQQLLADRILTREVVGHSHRCRLDLRNDKTLLYLSLLEAHKRDRLLATHPKIAHILERIDLHSASDATLLAWYREDELLIVTGAVTFGADASQRYGMATRFIPLAAFLHDRHLRLTVADARTLLFGHALYASLLREVRQ